MAYVTAESRDIDYWQKRWTTGATGWQLPDPNKHLLKQANIFLNGGKKYRILVPLCGKTVDLLWLYRNGHEVVGLDALDDVIVAYGKEHNLNFKVTTFKGGNLYQTADGRLKIYTGDFFKMSSSVLDKFDAVWDRGSLVAIDDENRNRYSNVVKQLLKPTFRYLLVAVEYTPTPDFRGPPSSVSVSEVENLFGDIAKVELLDIDDITKNAMFVNSTVNDAREKNNSHDT